MTTQLLVSTPLNLLMLDDGQVTIQHWGQQEDGNGNYHGITWDDRAVYVTGSDNFRYVVRVFDRQFRQMATLRNDLHQTHQAILVNGRLYVTNTGKNRVDIWDGQEWRWVAFNPSSCDIDHVNGIWHDGTRFWVTEFRHRKTAPSVVRICDGDLGLLETRTVGPPIHNVYVEAGRMFNLVSRQFKGILETVLDTGAMTEHHVKGEANNLMRGLARTRDNWFVGLSRWEEERGERHKGDAVVVVLDNRFREVDRWTVQDAGPVCDVRVISEPDLAHNGIPW